jgi:outer membrane protein OmpA-like peptidoglycan-associated protein
MKQFYIALFILSNFFLRGQNLVLNPSFEDFFDCPRSISLFHRNVKHWTIPTNGTTDYFNSCSEKIGFKNFVGIQDARTGSGYSGIYTYFKKDYREYIQGELKSTLIRGKTYKIRFYISLAEAATHNISNFDLQFYSKKVKQFSDSNLPKNSAQISFSIKEADLQNTSEWIEITGVYEAKGFENYFIIGNFDINSDLEKGKIPKSKGKSNSYYYIDDVSIEPLHDDFLVKEEKKPEDLSIKTNEVYTFKNVLFDFDKAELLDVSKEELDQLLKHLNSNPNRNVEIYGHTDNIGLDSRNKELSQQRAKAVADYLISHGLNTSRVQSFGFGSSKPISDNSTEESRQQNRRVEFKIIDN